MEYEGDGWLGYDRCFRQTVTRDIEWSETNDTLWNKDFISEACTKRCRLCFAVTHANEDCDLALNNSAQPFGNRRGNVCKEWNHSPDPSCP